MIDHRALFVDQETEGAVSRRETVHLQHVIERHAAIGDMKGGNRMAFTDMKGQQLVLFHVLPAA